METYSVQAVLSVTDRNFTLTMSRAADSMEGLDSASRRTTSSIQSIAKGMGAFKALSIAAEALKDSLSGAVSRFDTMNQFPKVMQQIGFRAKESEASINKLSDGIQGVPTSLDEITASTQKLALLTGDLGKATDASIALNNAFYASGSSSADASRGLVQYTQMLSKGTVDIVSWRTLQETMGVALRDLAEAFGYAGSAATTDLYAALQSGEITFDQLNDKLIELDGGVNGFAERAKTASAGIGTSLTNMGIAVTRGMESMIRSTNEALENNGLPGFQTMIEEATSGINKAFSAASEGIGLLVSNLDTLVPVLGTATAGFVAYKAAMSISSGLTSVTRNMAMAVDTLEATANASKLAEAAALARAKANKTAELADRLCQKSAKASAIAIKSKAAAEKLSEAAAQARTLADAGGAEATGLKAAADKMEAAAARAQANANRDAARAETLKRAAENADTRATILNTAAEGANTVAETAGAKAATVSSIAIAAKTALLGVLSGKLGLVAAAQMVWNAAMNASPVGVIVVTTAALATALVGVSKALEKLDTEAAEARKKREETISSSKELLETLESTEEAYKENVSGINAEATANDKLAGKIGKLAGKEGKSADEKSRLKSCVEALNSSMEGLNLQYDEENDALNMSIDQIKAKVAAYKAQADAQAGHAMTFAEYLEVFDTGDTVELGLNEVSGQAVTNEWTGTATILARLFSLANVFHAEIEFVPELNRDYSLKRLVMNVYKENDGECQGIGRKRNDITLRYGVNVKGITKSSDITGLRTAIRPVGTDGLMVTGLDKNEFDSDGNLEFTSPVGDGCIYAVQARGRFPSNLLNNGSDGYVVKVWSYSTDNANVLYGQALAELKKVCVPQVSYEVDGYLDTEIGDTVLIVDDEFVPELYLEARVTEQVRSFTDPVRNKTTFDNFSEMQSQVDGSLLDKMNELIKANKIYSCTISSSNGIVFRNGCGRTMLTANVRNAGNDVTDLFIIQWRKDGVIAAIGRTLTVNAEDVEEKAVYEFEAWDSSNILRGAYEVTVTSISDGKDGKDGENGKDGEDGKNGTDGVGILSVVNKYAVSFSGNLVPEEWLDTVPVMTTANRYLWNYEIITYTDGTVYETEKHVIGVYGNTGEDGPATGVTVSEVEPPEKFIGMLWKHTGGVPGLIKGATYRWNGKAWELYVFVADNIDVNSIFAKDITATGVIRGAELIGASGSFSGSIKCNGSIYMYSPVYGREFKFIDVQYTSVLDNTTITFYDVFGNPFMKWSTASVGADIVAFPQSVFCQKDITARYVRTTGGVDLDDVDKAVNALKGLKVIDKGSVVLSPGGKKYAMLKRFPASPSRPPYTIVATNGHQNANDAYPVGTTLWQNSNSQWEAYVYFSAASTVAMRINYIIFGDT